jgi:class 3 adenylate cyclase/DNA-binding winged helix-turn-helix (wHTH) protein
MTYVFGDYELDIRLYELRCAGTPIKLEPRVFNVLVYLVQHRDQLVTKQELFDHLWPDQFVGDAALERCIRAARQAVGDSGRTQRLIKTLHSRGYRFVAAVEERILDPPGSEALVASPAPSEPEEHASDRTDAATDPAPPPEGQQGPLEEEPSSPPDVDARRCAACQHVNSAAATYCVRCGTRLVQNCPGCGQIVYLPAAFCPACGEQLAAEPPTSHTETIHTTPIALEGERKQVTVLCCALSNVTALAERLGLEAMHHLAQEFFALAQRQVQQYEGTIQHVTDDGFMALFGAPVAYEDHARRAVLAAFGIRQRLCERHATLGTLHGEELAVRMGLHTGLMVVGRIEDDRQQSSTVVGETTNLAARLQYLAEPGTVLVSQATLRFVQGDVHCEASGPIQVTGQTDPITVYKVLGIESRRSPRPGLEERPLSRFVGRERELTVLHELLTQVENGQGQVVGMVGEPGMGKSRLLYEFSQSLQGKPVTYLEGRCLSYGHAIPYLPMRDIMRTNCEITDADNAETITTKVRVSLEGVGMDPEAGAPYLLQLLGLPEGTERLARLTPEAIKARTFETLRQMSLHGSRQRPLIIVVEDLHWVDTASETFFAALVESLVGTPILLLATYRPGYRPPWIDKSYATQIALHRLMPQDSLMVVHAVVSQDQIPDALVQVILAKAEGNPFFLEELARVVVEHGALEADVTVPDTIQGVLMARIDRLPEAAKQVLQTASVLGREVSGRLLQAIWEGPGGLEPHLQALQRLEFLYERTAGEEPVYVFKHALTQEVAYEGLLRARRQALHTAVGPSPGGPLCGPSGGGLRPPGTPLRQDRGSCQGRGVSDAFC